MAKNVIIGQSGGPTAVINSSLAGVYKAACSLGADKVYGMKHGIEGLLKEELVELNVLLDDRLSIELLKRTPSSYLGSCRYKLPEPEADSTPYVKLFTLFDKYDICAVFYIGGNDSMDTIAKLSRYGAQVGSAVRFIGVPKTIDNDLCLTDHTPGYGSAAKYIGVVMKEIIRDATVYGTKYVTVVEIMGRNAGWLTAAAALALRVPVRGIREGLGAFRGAGRRFEHKGTYRGAQVYDDYAHHPEELRALLTMAQSLGYGRVICAFQPHTYSRTHELFSDFVEVLKLPDQVLLAEIFAAREQNELGISSRDLAARIPGAVYCATLEQTADELEKLAQPGDMIITVGAGDIYRAGELLLKRGDAQ